MAISPMAELIHQFRRMALLRDGAGFTDGQLLENFISRHDEAGLVALVQRHGPMVWGVCRRILANYHDADDAFQATFLVLVRKAMSIRPRDRVANWLYGVAHQTALKARATVSTRRGRERQVVEMPEPAMAEPAQWDEVLPILDEELSRLPDKYRVVIVLCDVEGETRKEAARQLGVPEGTVAGWIARARMMLAKQLTQRGVTLSAGALAAILSQNVASGGVPASVVFNTIKAASLTAAGQATTGAISVKVAALTEGVLKTMFLSKLKVVVGAIMLVVVLVGGGVVISLGQPPDSPKPKKADPEPKQAKAKEDAAKAMLKRLEGTWELVSGHAMGERSPTAVVFHRIKGDTWEGTTREGKVIETGTYKLVDLDASPKRIDSIEDKDVPGRNDKTLNGIFMLDGDSLIMCFGAVARPKGFLTERGDGCVALQFERYHVTTPIKPR
jgi:RNA polymerase sigma factor (sigma-70 family)